MQTKITKQELRGSTEQVFHRKSGRRRVARDIFLVFEEEPKNVSLKGRRSNKLKTKFGHLNVGDLHINGSYKKTKSAIYSVKTESKCFLKRSKIHKSVNSTKINNHTGSSVPTAKVNPIFLWVKQDDTRIIEVRCEDYDKRNRICITKTSNGWRAMPRTDPLSSRVVKFFQTPSLKRETDFNQEAKSEDNRNRYTKSIKFVRSDKKSKRRIGNKSFFLKRINSNKIDDSFIKKCRNFTETISCENDTKNETESKYAKNIDFISIENMSSLDETYQSNSPELQLCPETGLFVPKIYPVFDDVVYQINEISDIFMDLEESVILRNINKAVKIHENLDDETKNLKDLLEDADLLQNCTDNANIGVELIDTLVKDSCENNLTLGNEMGSGNNQESREIFESGDSFNQKDRVLDVSVINNSPKSLSFNEAGEIEGLNGELFQSSNDAFSKQSTIQSQITSSKNYQSEHQNSNIAIKMPDTYSEDLPKDLSYSNREDKCPTLITRNRQCANNSTSDAFKSSSSTIILDPTSDEFKNMIFEKFLKIRPFNITENQQREPINLEKNKGHINFNDISEKTYLQNGKDICGAATNKARVDSVRKDQNEITSKIDKDPDPLTQLKLLIRSNQWKVPDPILVPKDRLRAVLASPAREIPLLLTTRPELKLPEAFAYPEILQNPNILVISMAQLEAILRNELDIEKRKLKIEKTKVPLDTILSSNHLKSNIEGIGNSNFDVELYDSKLNCPQKSSLDPNINTMTLAVINQMLLLPYYGNISQEIVKLIQDQAIAQNKVKNNNLIPCFGQKYYKESLEANNISKQTINCNKKDSQETNALFQPNQIRDFPPPFNLEIISKLSHSKMHHVIDMQEIRTLRKKYKAESSNIIFADTEQKANAELNISNELRHIQGTYSIRNGSTEELSNENTINKLTVNGINSEIVNTSTPWYNNHQKNIESKPRLSCKSLSNLLDPENITKPTVPLVNLITDNIKHTYINNVECENSKTFQNPAHCVVTSTFPQIVVNTNERCGINPGVDNHTSIHSNIVDTSPIVHCDSNSALWHPLFGSKNKHGYSSPWQWTTVTAPGE